jgi:transposase
MWGPVLLGLLTRTAMDARGCWCRDAPRLLTHTPTDKRLGLSFLGSVGGRGAGRRGARLVEGVTRGRAWPQASITVVSAAFGERCVDRPSRRKEADMASLASTSRVVGGGIDTHKDLHVVAVLDTAGALVGPRRSPHPRRLPRPGPLAARLRRRAPGRHRGTGSSGAGSPPPWRGRDRGRRGRPARPLRPAPAWQERHPGCRERRPRCPGRPAHQHPKSKDGKVQALRGLRLTRQTAVKSHRVALPRLGNQIVAAPEELRDQVRNLTPCSSAAPVPPGDPTPAASATRGRHPDRPQVPGPPDPGAGRRDRRARPAHHHLVGELAPQLLAAVGIGWRPPGSCWSPPATTPAAAQRGCLRDAVRRRAAARLLRQDPTPPAESGRRPPSQLGAAPDRGHPHAGRQPTKADVARRIAQGHSKLEIIRCSSAMSPARSTTSSSRHPGEHEVPGRLTNRRASGAPR